MLAAAALLIAVAACGPASTPGPPTPDASLPLLLEGIVIDEARLPVAGALVHLEVLDTDNAEVGEPVPVVFAAKIAADENGAFQFRLRPPDELVQHAASNGNFVNFGLYWAQPDGRVWPMSVWHFSSEIVGDEWRTQQPALVLTPDGAETPG